MEEELGRRSARYGKLPADGEALPVGRCKGDIVAVNSPAM